jgi:transcriptional regulator with XRE-family HTH domain
MTGGTTVPAWARRLADLRRSRRWSVADVAAELKKLREGLPSVESLTHMIRSDWEAGRHRPGPRYRPLLAALYGLDEDELFGEPTTPGVSPHNGAPAFQVTDGWTRHDAEELAGMLANEGVTSATALRVAHEWVIAEPPQVYELRSGRRVDTSNPRVQDAG